jgi:hypothetical protein
MYFCNESVFVFQCQASNSNIIIAQGIFLGTLIAAITRDLSTYKYW